MSRQFILAVMAIVIAMALIYVFAFSGGTSAKAGFSASDYQPMDDFTTRFNQLLSEDKTGELRPAAELSAEDLSWLLEDADGITLKAAKGLQFANGDILIILCIESGDNLLQELITETMNNQALDNLMGTTQYSTSVSIGGDIKYIILTKNDDYDVIGEMVETAKQPLTPAAS